MFSHILVCTDGSGASDKAVAYACDLAAKTGAHVTAYHAIDPFPAVPYPEYAALRKSSRGTQWDADQQKRSDRILRKCVDAGERAGVNCRTRSGRTKHPYEGILATARREKCDVIVMASHGRRGVKAAIMGSETNKVLAHAKLPVLVVR